RTQHRAGARHEQAQVIVDFSDGSNGATRVRSPRLLIDGNRRLKTFDAVNVRPLHLLEELPGINRKALHVLPLPFGKESIESERTFARSADAGNHDKPI